MWTSGFDYSRQVPCYFLMGCTLRALSFNLDPFMFVTFFSALQSIAVGNRRISNCLRCEQWKKEKKKKVKINQTDIPQKNRQPKSNMKIIRIYYMV